MMMKLWNKFIWI